MAFPNSENAKRRESRGAVNIEGVIIIEEHDVFRKIHGADWQIGEISLAMETKDRVCVPARLNPGLFSLACLQPLSDEPLGPKFTWKRGGGRGGEKKWENVITRGLPSYYYQSIRVRSLDLQFETKNHDVGSGGRAAVRSFPRFGIYT